MDSRDNAPALRKGLMVIAKIIQNLANNIFFGKEPHMRPLNKFLQSNITNVTTFLSELKVMMTLLPDHFMLMGSIETS